MTSKNQIYPNIFGNDELIYGCSECKYPTVDSKNIDNILFTVNNEIIGILTSIIPLCTEYKSIDKYMYAWERKVYCNYCHSLLSFSESEIPNLLKNILDVSIPARPMNPIDEYVANAGHAILNINSLVLLPNDQLYGAFISRIKK